MLLDVCQVLLERVNDGLTSLLVRWYLDTMGGTGSNVNHSLECGVLQSLNGLFQRHKCELGIQTLSNSEMRT